MTGTPTTSGRTALIDAVPTLTRRSRILGFLLWYASAWLILLVPLAGAWLICEHGDVLAEGNFLGGLSRIWFLFTAPVVAATVFFVRAWRRAPTWYWLLGALMSGALCLTCESELIDRARGTIERRGVARRLGIDRHELASSGLNLYRHLLPRVVVGTTTREQVLDLMRMAGARAICRPMGRELPGLSEYYPFFGDVPSPESARVLAFGYDERGVVRVTDAYLDSVRPPQDLACTSFR